VSVLKLTFGRTYAYVHADAGPLSGPKIVELSMSWPIRDNVFDTRGYFIRWAALNRIGVVFRPSRIEVVRYDRDEDRGQTVSDCITELGQVEKHSGELQMSVEK